MLFALVLVYDGFAQGLTPVNTQYIAAHTQGVSGVGFIGKHNRDTD